MIHKEEALHFHNEELIALIDRMLQGIDEKEMRAKGAMIAQQSIASLEEMVKEHKITYEELTVYYLMRIRDFDQNEQGMNAVSEINPYALEEARKYDVMDVDLPLKGIPVLLKENINTCDLPTSAGSYGLRKFVPKEDAVIVRYLKENGAVILGKANLSEMAYYMSEHNPSGYSAKKGQTHNPFGPLKLSALGSSTGSAVAMAMDLAAAAIGTETCGSIVAPASVCSAVGYKPSHDLVDGTGIVPISFRLDTPGPITKTVQDAVAVMNAISKNQFEIPKASSYLKGKRIGLIQELMKEDGYWKDVRHVLWNLGVEVVEVSVDAAQFDVGLVLQNDFRHDLDAYLECYQAPIHSLEELAAYNAQDPDVRMRYGQTMLEESLAFQNRDEQCVNNLIGFAKRTIEETLEKHNLDGFVFRNNEGAMLAALPGCPEVSVPFGMYDGAPAAVTFFTKTMEDEHLLKMAYSFEQNTKSRVIPNND